MPALGIDLGTTKCCIGIILSGRVTILENEDHEKLTPSCVAFSAEGRMFGNRGKGQLSLNPQATCYGVKRLLGQEFDNITNSKYLYNMSSENGKAALSLKIDDCDEIFYPEQVAAMLITKMRTMAETRFNCGIYNAVITVPSHFTSAQRMATINAGKIAGINVLGLVNSTTAIALAYRDHLGSNVINQTVYVLDFGGGFVDISVVSITDAGIKTHAVFGKDFGGYDIDIILLEYFLNDFENQHRVSLTCNPKAVARLRLACEKVKHTLSLLPYASLTVDCLHDGLDYELKINRETFEKLCMEPVSTVLNTLFRRVTCFCSDKDILNMEGIIIVGGSSRMPLVQKIVQESVSCRIIRSVNVDEDIAYGATMKAALLDHDNSVEDVFVSEVYPNNISYINRDGDDVCLFPSNCSIPHSITCENLEMGHSKLILKENLSGGNSRVVASLELETNNEITVHIDASGIMTLKKSGYSKLNNCYPCNWLSSFLLQNMCERETSFKADDAAQIKRQKAMNLLEKYCYKKKELVLGSDVTLNSKKDLLKLLEHTILWIENNTAADLNTIDEKMTYVKDLHSCSMSASSTFDVDASLSNTTECRNLTSSGINKNITSITDKGSGMVKCEGVSARCEPEPRYSKDMMLDEFSSDFSVRHGTYLSPSSNYKSNLKISTRNTASSNNPPRSKKCLTSPTCDHPTDSGLHMGDVIPSFGQGRHTAARAAARGKSSSDASHNSAPTNKDKSKPSLRKRIGNSVRNFFRR